MICSLHDDSLFSLSLIKGAYHQYMGRIFSLFVCCWNDYILYVFLTKSKGFYVMIPYKY